jgi:hypothetical protein
MSAQTRVASRLGLEHLVALAILAALVCGLFLATFGVAYAKFADQQSQAEEMQRLLSRLEGVVERQSRLADYLGRGDDAARLQSIFLNTSQRGIGTARLQEQIAALANDSGVAVRRVSAVGSGDTGQISLQVQVTGSIVAFSSFLVGLENSLPWLFVDSMNVSQSRKRRGRSSAQPASNLVALLTISVYTGPGEAP